MLRSFQGERCTLNRAALLRQAIRPAALAAAMFFMMRAELLMHASPLAAALFSAALAAGEHPAALVLGCLAGMMRPGSPQAALTPLFACALVLLAELMRALLLPGRRGTGEMRCALLAGIAVLLPCMIRAGGEIPASVQALAAALLAGIAAPFFLCMLRPEDRQDIRGRTGLALLLAAALTGMAGICMPIARGFSLAAVLLLPGAHTPAVCGLALLAAGAPVSIIAALALCSLGRADRFFRARHQKALGVLAAAALSALLCGPEAVDPFAALWTCGAYLLLPEALVRRAAALFAAPRNPEPGADEIARELCADLRRRLFALGDAFGDMAEDDRPPAEVPDEQELIFEMRARLCTGCTGYAQCWTGGDNRAVRLLCRLIADALERSDAPPGMRTLFSDGEIPPDVMRICRRGRMIPDRLSLLLRDFAEKRRCEIKRCDADRLVSMQFQQAREILYAMAEQQIQPAGSPGMRLNRLKDALEGCAVIACGREPGRIRLMREGPWTRDGAQRALNAVQRCMGGHWLSRADGEALQLQRAPRLQADTGASCRSGVAGEACGDSHIICMLDENRMLMAISDGMGSGETAARESLRALALLRRFLEAGIARAPALEAVNRRLLTQGCEDMFATLDLCILDLNSGIAEFSKLAACRTLVLRGGRMICIEGGCLPLGILEGVKSETHQMRLRPGDTLIMGSDGVMETGDPLLVERLARECAGEQPEQIAALLVREAGLRRNARRRDDLTCICARITAAV